VFGSPSPNVISPAHAQRNQTDNKAKRSAPVHFPLRKRGDLGTRASNGRRILSTEEAGKIRRRDLERQRNLRRRNQPNHSKKSGWETLGITNFEGDDFYYMSLQIGTPPQTMDIAIDTGSGSVSIFCHLGYLITPSRLPVISGWQPVLARHVRQIWWSLLWMDQKPHSTIRLPQLSRALRLSLVSNWNTPTERVSQASLPRTRFP
jgi:hypothetical protein